MNEIIQYTKKCLHFLDDLLVSVFYIIAGLFILALIIFIFVFFPVVWIPIGVLYILVKLGRLMEDDEVL